MPAVSNQAIVRVLEARSHTLDRIVEYTPTRLREMFEHLGAPELYGPENWNSFIRLNWTGPDYLGFTHEFRSLMDHGCDHGFTLYLGRVAKLIKGKPRVANRVCLHSWLIIHRPRPRSHSHRELQSHSRQRF